jgi:hypothetical protein
MPDIISITVKPEYELSAIVGMEMIVTSLFFVTNCPCSFCLQVVKQTIELEAEHVRGTRLLEKMNVQLKKLQAQLHDFRTQHMQSTQVSRSLKSHAKGVPCKQSVADSVTKNLGSLLLLIS